MMDEAEEVAVLGNVMALQSWGDHGWSSMIVMAEGQKRPRQRAIRRLDGTSMLMAQPKGKNMAFPCCPRIAYRPEGEKERRKGCSTHDHP